MDGWRHWMKADHITFLIALTFGMYVWYHNTNLFSSLLVIFLWITLFIDIFEVEDV